ncbi:LysR family transcriptional regulator [Limobrevibacterium gyesilva]|uniref:LysR family transcriptional regulator n=1 Tax=Limobrevibacterium gyesilva TaxID=2991712 RepID=A0AA42CDG4_9PROT|nr:LysR family transcriptional regulator [Limobrevibacterium gyesilva]MCW3473809.1 LysR family transcriptional regulator [Limobrevibacterium gyesilva]
MELHEIRYFLAVSKTLNFTKAAEQCNVTQPALTRAIQKMEEELGGLLFSRERNNTHLTDLGRLLEPHLTEMLERASTAKRAASRFLRLEGAQLTVGVMCTIGPIRFVGFLNRLRTSHPGIELTLIEGVPDHLTELLIRGELDVAVMARPGGFAEPLRSQPLYEERFTIACSVGHRLAQKNIVSMSDIDGEIYLQRINCEYRDFLAERLNDAGANILRSYRSEREDWIQIMVAAGMGICFLPEFSATLPGLVTRPVVEPAVMREVSLVTVGGRRWSSPVAAFINAVKQYEWPSSTAELEGYAVLSG